MRRRGTGVRGRGVRVARGHPRLDGRSDGAREQKEQPGVARRVGAEEATTIRTLLDYRWTRDTSGVLIAEVKADAFCHSMVRALVGACAAVGEGRLGVADVAGIRDAGIRTSETKVLAARGLTLTEVGYPADDLLALRAEQTRARRSLDED